MNTLFVYLLEASICLGVFYLFYLAILHRQPTFRYNRVYLLATAALGWVLPLLEIPLGFGSSAATAGQAANYFLLAPAEVGSATTESAANGFPWLLLAYGLGALAMLVFYGRQFFRLYHAIRMSEPYPVPHHRYQLLYTDGKFPTASFFRYLFWDNTQPLNVAETQQVMRHEETHIQQGHSYDVLYMTLIKTVAWFHPLVYLYDRALTQVHEYEADAGVLAQQPVSQKAYARLLSKHMLTSRNVLPVNRFFYPSQILTRINMLYANSQKTPWYRYVLIVPVFASLFLTFSCQPDEEEITRQAVAESYEEVKNNLETINQEIQTVVDRNFKNTQAFTDAINAYRAQNPGAPPPSAVDLLKGKVPTSTLRSLEKLIAQQDALREKLTSLPDADGIYTIVEEQPMPVNGMGAFYEYVGQNIKYPTEARQKGLEGKVFVQFVVDEYGTLTNAKAIKGIGGGLDEEAIRIIEEAKEWNPGTTKGEPVSVRMVMPITFKLDKPDKPAPFDGKREDVSYAPPTNEERQLEETVVVGYTK